jgi:hypothetical protein
MNWTNLYKKRKEPQTGATEVEAELCLQQPQQNDEEEQR